MKLYPVYFHAVAEVADLCVTHGARKATKYINDKDVVTATRRFKPRKGESIVDLVVKIGKANFMERKFIKLCQRAGETFPLKKVQVRWYE